jgi:hypothetical protein
LSALLVFAGKVNSARQQRDHRCKGQVCSGARSILAYSRETLATKDKSAAVQEWIVDNLPYSRELLECSSRFSLRTRSILPYSRVTLAAKDESAAAREWILVDRSNIKHVAGLPEFQEDWVVEESFPLSHFTFESGNDATCVTCRCWRWWG